LFEYQTGEELGLSKVVPGELAHAFWQHAPGEPEGNAQHHPW
jgi:hypothetical protein